jgi:hypothetical protein
MAVPTRAAAAYTHGNETDGWTIDWPGHPSSLSDTAGSSDTAGLSDTAGSSDIAGSELQPPVQQPAQVVTSAAAVVSLAPQEVVAAYDMERILCHKADRGRLRRTQPYKKHDHLSGGLPPLVGTPTNCSHPAAAAAAAVAARARAPLSPAWIYPSWGCSRREHTATSSPHIIYSCTTTTSPSRHTPHSHPLFL